MTKEEKLDKLLELKRLIQEVGFSKIKNRIGREALVRPCRYIEYQIFKEICDNDFNDVLKSQLCYDTYAAFRYLCQQLAKQKEFQTCIKLKMTLGDITSLPTIKNA